MKKYVMKLSKFSLFLLLLPIMGVFSILGCARADSNYVTISPQEAKAIMDKEKGYVILDVREPEEFKEGHIPNAVLLPLGSIERDAVKVLKDKEQLLLVYCRSGRRSKLAAGMLVKLGYSRVKEFGGILDWPYEVVR